METEPVKEEKTYSEGDMIMLSLAELYRGKFVCSLLVDATTKTIAVRLLNSEMYRGD